jgi:hypothetical protein
MATSIQRTAFFMPALSGKKPGRQAQNSKRNMKKLIPLILLGLALTVLAATAPVPTPTQDNGR